MSTRWRPGQSGNPKGRPKKARALATIIETVGNVKDDSGVANKRLLANTLWEVVTTRQWNGEHISLTQWLEIVQWLGVHIDGPVPQQLDVEQGGEITMRVIYGERNVANGERNSRTSEESS